MHSISLGFVNFFSSKTYLSDSVGNNIALDQVTRGIMVRPLYQFLIPLVQDPKGKFQLYFGVGGSPGIGFSQNHRTPVNQFPFHQTVFVLQAIPEISGHFFWRPNENWWLSAEIPCNIFDASLQFWKTQNQLQVNDSGTQADYNFLPGPYGIRLSANRLIQTRLKPIKTKLR